MLFNELESSSDILQSKKENKEKIGRPFFPNRVSTKAYGSSFIHKLSLSSLGQQDPREMRRQPENSSWRCSWTWTRTVTKLSTPTSRAPQTPRTSALSLLPSRTPSSSWTWRSTIWSNCASSTPPFPSLVGYWSYTEGLYFCGKQFA